MPDSEPKPARPWRVVAQEASQEHDPKKMTQLIVELNRALEEQGVVKREDEQKKKSA